MGVCASDKTGILSNKLVPVGIMIRTILVTLFFLGISQANDCFERCEINSYANYEGFIDDAVTENYGVGDVAITNYHCIMKCANRLSKATMDLALDNLHEDYNHQCIFIESLDYCVQYWKQNNQVDCEEPIRDMVKQNFHIVRNKLWY